jgi:hypothetical protein
LLQSRPVDAAIRCADAQRVCLLALVTDAGRWQGGWAGQERDDQLSLLGLPADRDALRSLATVT